MSGKRLIWCVAALAAVSVKADLYTWTAGYLWSEGAWTPAAPAVGGGADVSLIFSGSNEWTSENDRGDFRLNALDLASGTGTIAGSKLIFTADGETLPTIHSGLLSIFTAPIELASDTFVTSDTTLQFNSTISGPGTLHIQNTVFNGGPEGWTYLNRANTLEGGVDLLQGRLVVNCANVFGTGDVCVTNNARCLLDILGNQTYGNTFRIGSEQSNSFEPRLTADGGEVVLTGPVYTHQSKISAWNRGALHIRGGIIEDDYFALAPAGDSSIYVEEVPINHPGRKWYVGDGSVYLNVAGNEYGQLCFFGNAPILFCGGENVLSPNGFVSTQNNAWSTGTIELNGFSQVIGGINGDDGWEGAPNVLCIRNSNRETVPTVTIRQSTDLCFSGLWTQGPMNIVKEGPAALGVTGSFSVTGDLAIHAGRMIVGVNHAGAIADTVTVYAGAVLALGGKTVRCRRFELQGGVVSGGTLVADEIILHSGTVRAALVGPVEKTDAVEILVDMTAPVPSDLRPQYDLPPDVVAYYPFDSEESLLQDMGPYGIDLGLAAGENVFEETGYFGGALYFNGGTWYRTASGHFPNAFPVGSQPYTVAAFIKPDSDCSGSGGWIGYGQGGAEGLANNFRLAGGDGIHNYWWARDLTARGGINFYEGWHHVVGTYDGVTRKIYVDGVLQAQDNPVPPDFRPVEVAVGRTLNDAWFKGYIDDLLIARRALTSEEIVRLFQEGVEKKGLPVSKIQVTGGTLKTVPQERDLAICYHFDTAETLMEDASGNEITLKKNDGDGEPECAANGIFGAGALHLAGNAVMNAASDTFPASLPIGASPYTVCAFVKAERGCSGAGGWIGYGRRADGRSNNFRYNGNGFNAIWNYWWARDIGATIPSGSFMNTWHSVVGTFDGSTRKIFIDGIQCASDTSMGAPDIDADEFAVGRTIGDAWFKGWIDELAVYTRALEPAEILSYHLTGIKTTAGSFADGTELVIGPDATVSLAGDERVAKVGGTGTVTDGKLIVTDELDGVLRITGDLALADGMTCIGNDLPTVVEGTVHVGEGCHVKAAAITAGQSVCLPLISAASFVDAEALATWVIDDVQPRFDAKAEIRDGTLYVVVSPRATILIIN